MAGKQSRRQSRQAAHARRYPDRSQPEAELLAPGTSAGALALPARTRTYGVPTVHPGLFPLLHLVAITLAEVTTIFVDTRWGIVGYGAILALLVTQAAVAAFHAGPESERGARSHQRLRANFYSAVALIPLIRIVSLAMPLEKFPRLTWYGLIAVPLLAATWSVAKSSGYSRQELGLRLDRRPLQFVITLLVSISGIGLGYLEYRILRPEPLIDQLSPIPVLAASLILLIGTGLTEELIFRGALQIASAEFLGPLPGILYASLLFTLLHAGQRSWLDLPFVFGVAIAFSLIVRWTRSIIGVTLAHGLTNIGLFVIFPLVLSQGTR